MRLFSKSIYKSRFYGYRFVAGLVYIVQGILTVLTIPFKVDVILLEQFSLWNLNKDMKRRKKVSFKNTHS
jgi:hypothetical protein